MKQILSAAALLLFLCAQGQKEFFRSAQTYTPQQMQDFYASLNVHNNLLLFNAPDYNLYAYDKAAGR